MQFPDLGDVKGDVCTEEILSRIYFSKSTSKITRTFIIDFMHTDVTNWRAPSHIDKMKVTNIERARLRQCVRFTLTKYKIIFFCHFISPKLFVLLISYSAQPKMCVIVCLFVCLFVCCYPNRNMNITQKQNIWLFFVLWMRYFNLIEFSYWFTGSITRANLLLYSYILIILLQTTLN